MACPLTYGQCLHQVMESNHLSVNTLSRKMGFHGSTQLTRILRDEVSPALITKFHQQFMLIFDWLISPGDIRALSAALQYSCLGPDSFLLRQAMNGMVFSCDAPDVQDMRITLHGPSGPPVRVAPGDAPSCIGDCRSLDVLVLGSAFDALLPALLTPAGAPAPSLRIRHVFVLEEQPAQLVSQISALLPFVNTDVYEGLYLPESAQESAKALRGHQIALLRHEHADGSVFTDVLTPPRQDALSICRLPGDNALFSFYEAYVDALRDQLRPIKVVYPQPDSVKSLLTLCQRDLFLEQNHACCFVRLDLCFHALPAEQVLRALDGGRALGLAPDAPLMQELIRVHDARYRNLLHKKETTHFILSRPAMAGFVRTGRLSDHLFAMRAFTPGERRAILTAFIGACRANPSLHVHLLRSDADAPAACFCGYADMGVQISDNHTTYDIRGHHSEAFVGLPAFADTLSAYCVETLIPEACLGEEESLSCLETLLSQELPREEENHA